MKQPMAFEELDFPQKDCPKLLASRYRVYSDASNYTVIEASSAIEAMENSKVENAVRIVRENIKLHRILDLESISAKDANVPDVDSEIDLSKNQEQAADSEKEATSEANDDAAKADESSAADQVEAASADEGASAEEMNAEGSSSDDAVVSEEAATDEDADSSSSAS